MSVLLASAFHVASPPATMQPAALAYCQWTGPQLAVLHKRTKTAESCAAREVGATSLGTSRKSVLILVRPRPLSSMTVRLMRHDMIVIYDG